ncbi:MAG: hypothetical protein JW910_10495 [Anaerolineae bacterium]|nr:hypothetical protein [Anaerolineae bacterium]
MTFVSPEKREPEDEFEFDQSPAIGGPDPDSAPTPPEQPAVRPKIESESAAARARAASKTPSQAMPPVPPPQARRGAEPNRRGCLLPMLGILFVVLVLVVIGVLLPPISLLDQLGGSQYVALNADTPGVTHSDGLTLTIDPAQPGDGFGVILSAIDAQSFTAGSAADAWAGTARSALPPALRLISPVYSIDSEGEPPAAIALRINTPAGASPFDTMDLYAWNEAEARWQFVPSQLAEGDAVIVTDLNYVPQHVAVFQTSAPAITVAVPLDVTQVLSADVASVAGMLMPAGLQPTIQGTLQGGLAANFETGAGYSVLLTIRNYGDDPNALDVTTVEAILGNDSLLAEHVRQLAACAVSCYQGGAVSGIAIDYRGISPDLRDRFSLFVRELGRGLDANRQSLLVVVPAATEGAPGQPWDTGAYDWRAIGRYADTVQIVLGVNPLDYASGGTVERMLRWGVGEISRYQIQVNLSAQSYRQIGQDNPSFVPISFAEAVSGLGNVTVTSSSELSYFLPGESIEVTLNGYAATTGFDEAAQTPYIEYENAAGRIWLTTQAALVYRMNLARMFNIGGVAVRDLLAPGITAETVQAVADLVLNTAPAADENVELTLHWEVVSASGAVVSAANTGISDSFQWQAVGQDGNYAINVQVIGGGQSSQRGGQQVAVANPTDTPTPTFTPSPEPTATPTPRPTSPPAPTADTSANTGGSTTTNPNPNPPPPSGSISGSFEIGGHVADLGSAVSYMQRAGMTWVKVQVRYGHGGDPGGEAGIINAAHANGFRILLGVVGYPNEIGSIPEDQYFPAYANFVGGLAALGADAIEVWNEMNIDREWPQGRIDPAMYTRLLAAAYNSIRANNGSTLVISGALAPTGAEGAFGTDRVWNDDRYYQGMADAGVANYADCIGAHYNEGIVPPDQVGNDPRGGYPTYFLDTMTNRVSAPFGGSRPVCYTELGYLSPEGYGELPGGFAWAQNVTVAQQAAWLAGAAVRLSARGDVRIMIVWNVNFSNFGADPMAGYAMVRPGGGCPACDALGNVAR